MMTFLEFTFTSFWHFFGVLILQSCVIAAIVDIVNAFMYRANNNKRLKALDKSIEQTKQDLKALKATIQKDREVIADSINELTKNSK